MRRPYDLKKLHKVDSVTGAILIPSYPFPFGGPIIVDQQYSKKVKTEKQKNQNCFRALEYSSTIYGS